MKLLRVLPEEVNRLHNTRNPIFQPDYFPQKRQQIFVSTLTQTDRQGTIVLKINSEHDRNAEHLLLMWNRVENIFLKMVTEDDHSFYLSGRTETADFAGKLKQKLLSTVGTTNSGESFLQIATLQMGSNHILGKVRQFSGRILKYLNL